VTKTSNPSKGLSVTGKTRESVVAFFGNLQERKFSEAERELENIKDKKFNDDEFKQGYMNALEGLLQSVRSGDEREFFNRANLTGENLKSYMTKFEEFRKVPTRTLFDSGYFTAWNDLLQFKRNIEE